MEQDLGPADTVSDLHFDIIPTYTFSLETRYLTERHVGGGRWTLCRLQFLQQSCGAATSRRLLRNTKLLVPHVSHSVLKADAPLAHRRPRVPGDAGLRCDVGVRQGCSQQLGDTEVQPVAL